MAAIEMVAIRSKTVNRRNAFRELAASLIFDQWLCFVMRWVAVLYWYSVSNGHSGSPSGK